MSLPDYDIFAIRYAKAERPRRDFLLHADPHDRVERIDYFVWLIRDGGGRILLVDTGFGEGAANRRGRTILRSPVAGLAELGVPADSVETVIITHLHYDHAGNLNDYPNALFYLQEREMSGATGKDMCHAAARVAFELEDVQAMVGHVFAERVKFVDGDCVLAPGISLHLVPGHTRGLQVVRVHTQRGWVVLASDALHFYANILEGKPFPVLVDLPAAAAGAHHALSLGDGGDHVIPGHDPQVLDLFPAYPLAADVAEVSKAPLMPTPLAGMTAGGPWRPRETAASQVRVR